MKKNKLSKYIEFVKSLVRKTIHEKKYQENGETIKYILELKDNSRELIIIFSACTRAGIPARYNYMKTLEKIKCNKLFILDDFGMDKRGGYYLGLFPDYNYEKNTKALIDKIIDELQIKKCYFCGSSKGGWAALNFGVMYNEGVGNGIIIGAPQYHLGDYLNAPANCMTLNSIAGDSTPENVIDELNNHLRDNLIRFSKEILQPIYIHYSETEHTYQDHIIDLLQILNDLNYQVHCDIKQYEAHWDVSIFYPDFLLSSLEILNVC